jgi:hypothetical protein
LVPHIRSADTPCETSSVEGKIETDRYRDDYVYWKNTDMTTCCSHYDNVISPAGHYYAGAGIGVIDSGTGNSYVCTSDFASQDQYPNITGKPLVLDHDPTLAFALTLFEDGMDEVCDIEHNDEDCNSDDNMHANGFSGFKRKHITSFAGSGAAARTVKAVASKKSNKRTKPTHQPAAASSGVSSSLAPSTAVGSKTWSPETLRVRELLEAKAREIIAQHTNTTQLEEAFQAASSSPALSSTEPPVAHQSDPRQHFRAMMQALNGGSFSDLCDIVDRLYAAKGCYKRSIIGVSWF